MKISQLGVFLDELMYAAAFSFCAIITFGDVFFRKIRHSIFFPIISGAAVGLVTLGMLMLGGEVNITPILGGFYAAHTLAAFWLLTEKSKDSFIALIFSEVFCAALFSIIQMAVFSLSNGKEKSFLLETLLYLTSFAVSAGFVFLLKTLVRSDDREPLGKLQMLLLTGIVCAVSALVRSSFTMSDYIPDVSAAAAVPSALMLMSITALLMLSVKQQQAKRFRELQEMSEKYMSAQAKHFEQTREADTQLRMLRHDMKNHITVMNGLLDSGKNEELGKYLKELGSAFEGTQAVNSIGNEIADAIICEKRNYAQSMGETLAVEGSLKGLEINAVTLCTVLSNLLDNAIEAASETDNERLITLCAKRSGSFFYIRITNPTPNSINVSEDIPTTKSDSSAHGLGIKSVKRAVERCGGTLELGSAKTADSYEFSAEVILPADN